MEPAVKGVNLYCYVKYSNLPLVEEKDIKDSKEGKLYNIEVLISKRISDKEV